jgi:hypothetical protein
MDDYISASYILLKKCMTPQRLQSGTSSKRICRQNINISDVPNRNIKKKKIQPKTTSCFVKSPSNEATSSQ